jgi:hypothetical protein
MGSCETEGSLPSGYLEVLQGFFRFIIAFSEAGYNEGLLGFGQAFVWYLPLAWLDNPRNNAALSHGTRAVPLRFFPTNCRKGNVHERLTQARFWVLAPTNGKIPHHLFEGFYYPKNAQAQPGQRELLSMRRFQFKDVPRGVVTAAAVRMAKYRVLRRLKQSFGKLID